MPNPRYIYKYYLGKMIRTQYSYFIMKKKIFSTTIIKKNIETSHQNRHTRS